MTKKRENALIVGGTSGLGHEIAKCIAGTHKVTVTGRTDTHKDMNFQFLDLNTSTLRQSVNRVILKTGPIDLLVYAAGFYQDGKIDELNDKALESMVKVQLLGPALFVAEILRTWGSLPKFVAVTSTSEWTPRLNEPMYAATKRGLAALSESISLDERVGKTLVVGPSGMKTPFWREHPILTEGMLDSAWVAVETMKLLAGEFRYRHAKILRNPARVEITQTRD